MRVRVRCRVRVRARVRARVRVRVRNRVSSPARMDGSHVGIEIGRVNGVERLVRVRVRVRVGVTLTLTRRGHDAGARHLTRDLVELRNDRGVG